MYPARPPPPQINRIRVKTEDMNEIESNRGKRKVRGGATQSKLAFHYVTVKVAQLLARVLFPFQVHDRDDDAGQHDHEHRQQHDDPSLAVCRRRIRPSRIRRVHDDGHRGAVGSVPAPGVRLDAGRETTAHRQVEQNRRRRRVQKFLYGGLCRVVVFHLYLKKKKTTTTVH